MARFRTPEPKPPSAPATTPVDREALRILAHPLRARILTELRALGRATSADLARLLDTSTGVTSYHLRIMAEAGLITEDPTNTGRKRYWLPATEDRPLDLDDADADDEASAEWLARDYAAHVGNKLQGWISDANEWPLEWQQFCGLNDALVLVTDTQLAALQNEIAALLAKYRRVGAGNPGAKRVTYYTCALPVDRPPQY